MAADTARALETVVADLRDAVDRLRRERPAENDEFAEGQLTSVVGGAGRLATQLLAYAGKQTLRPERLELLSFLSDFAHRLRRALDQRIDVSVDVGHDCPACFVDARALEDALLNLVVNARDAIPEGGRLWLAAAGQRAPGDSPAVDVSVSDLTEAVATVTGDSEAWARYWRDNPVRAWTGGNLADQRNAHFATTDGRFQIVDPPAAEWADSLATMLQELVDFRLATYEARRTQPAAGGNVVPFPQRTPSGVELAYFPNLKIACGHFKTGRADADEHRRLPASYGTLDPSRHFIARASGRSMDGGKSPIRDGDYLLLELLSPARAGSITGTVMAIERQDESGDNQYLLRVVTKGRDGRYVLKANNPDYEDMLATDDMRTLARLRAVIDPLDLAVGQRFMREDIPALFGEVYNAGNWNSGHVALNDKKVVVLLVTLSKRGKSEDHRYIDHWIDEHTFHWQSQNQTSPDSKRGQEIIHHEARGIAIHLFVRDEKLAGGKGAPFTYYGRATYRSHQGSEPMSVVFSVDGP